MFLRRHRKVVDEVSCDDWTLCASVRTAAGPRQRVVATLGKLDDAEASPEAGWEDLSALLEGRARRPKARQRELGEACAEPATAAPTEQWEPTGPEPAASPEPAEWAEGVADLAALRVGRVRDFGEVWLGLSLGHRLGLHKLVASLVEPGKAEVAWEDVAAVLTVARFCAQRSELSIAEHCRRP